MDNEFTPSGSITARIIDYDAGMNVLQNIRGIRIQSKEYGLLIMEDYVPTLGKVEGKIVFLTRDDEVIYENIKGFYKHQYNEFTILLENQAENVVDDEEEDGGNL
ncbi:MAG: hypothetical protein R3Y58_06475 [Eubacteriales bacterium]